VADDHGQNFLLGDQNCLGAGDLSGLGDHRDLHLLDVVDDYLLQTVEPDDRCARHYLCEVRDQNQVYRRVAWHLDAIANNAQLCLQHAKTS